MKRNLVGAVYPLPINIINRFFRENKTVFVKYLRTTNTRLRIGMKLLFYASKSGRKIVGEGLIESLEFLTPQEALTKYGNKLLLNEEEMRKYTTSQPGRDLSKKLLVVRLKRLREYKQPVTYPRTLTMAGEYLTKEAYKSLSSKI